MNGEFATARIMDPLYRAKGWIKFVGVLSIIQGVLSILSIWGILICWLPMWMGVLLCRASNHLRAAYETNNDSEIHYSMEHLGTYFRVSGILALVMVGLALIAMIAAILVPAFAKALRAV
jgi:hypothetical protein